MRHHFADRLIAKIDETNSFGCLGIDPRPDWSPFEENGLTPSFELDLSLLAAGRLPAIKPQAAFLGDSIERMRRLGSIAKRDGVLTVADVKRGDIGTTAEAYAEEWLKTPFDAITVNPYLGLDSLEPFAKVAEREGRGIFVLVRTSNKGALDIQDLETNGDWMRVYEHVAQMVNDLGAATVGESGYSNIGAVVGATVSPGIVVRLREIMPRTIFLMPGLGAQGGGIASVRAALDKNGHGVLAPSSRSLNYPWKDKDGKGSAPDDWRAAIAKAIDDFKKVTAVKP